jgi:hypothetical protein
MSELTVIEIKPEQAPTLYVPNGLDVYLEKSENWQKKFLTLPRKRVAIASVLWLAQLVQARKRLKSRGALI